MSVFKDFEAKALGLLLGGHLPEDEIAMVLASASFVSCEHTGVGYFLTVRHAILPIERRVYDRPLPVGAASGVECGFIVFLEGGELTLECYSRGGRVPEDIRDWPVEVHPTPTLGSWTPNAIAG